MKVYVAYDHDNDGTTILAVCTTREAADSYGPHEVEEMGVTENLATYVYRARIIKRHDRWAKLGVFSHLTADSIPLKCEKHDDIFIFTGSNRSEVLEARNKRYNELIKDLPARDKKCKGCLDLKITVNPNNLCQTCVAIIERVRNDT